jgi:hypothetical protein
MNIKKPVRKRSAVTGTLVGVRLQPDQINAIDSWAAKQSPPVTRPEAIRGIIEIGLTFKPSAKPTNRTERSSRARDLASKAVDKLSDPGADPEMRNERRKMLIKGPSEFRETRVDLPKRKS